MIKDEANKSDTSGTGWASHDELRDLMERYFMATYGECRPGYKFSRMYSFFIHSGVKSLEEIANLGAREFLIHRDGIRRDCRPGKKTLLEVQRLLEFYGLSFADADQCEFLETSPSTKKDSDKVVEFASFAPSVISHESFLALINQGLFTFEDLAKLPQKKYVQICTPKLVEEFQRLQKLVKAMESY